MRWDQGAEATLFTEVPARRKEKVGSAAVREAWGGDKEKARTV